MLFHRLLEALIVEDVDWRDDRDDVAGVDMLVHKGPNGCLIAAVVVVLGCFSVTAAFMPVSTRSGPTENGSEEVAVDVCRDGQV